MQNNSNQFLIDFYNEAKISAIQELEKEFLEEKNYILLQKLTKLKEDFLKTSWFVLSF